MYIEAHCISYPIYADHTFSDFYIDNASSGIPFSVDATNLSFTIPNLSPGSTYRYWIIPYSKGVTGPKSKEFTVKIPDGKFAL